MSTNGKGYIVGAFEHPTRKADNTSVAQLHAEVAYGALQDAGLSKDDVDGFFCTGAAPGLGPARYGGLSGADEAQAPRFHRIWAAVPM
jgi:acetyl-CoA C-acetyltransferase